MFLIIALTALIEDAVKVAIERLVAVAKVATTLMIIIETTTVTDRKKKTGSETLEIDTIKALNANAEDLAKDRTVTTVSIAVVTTGKQYFLS